MTRDEFFADVTLALRLLSALGVPELRDIDAKVASFKAGRAGVTPVDLRRYAEAIDWSAPRDGRLAGELAQVLLRLLAGVASELDGIRRAQAELGEG